MAYNLTDVIRSYNMTSRDHPGWVVVAFDGPNGQYRYCCPCGWMSAEPFRADSRQHQCQMLRELAARVTVYQSANLNEFEMDGEVLEWLKRMEAQNAEGSEMRIM